MRLVDTFNASECNPAPAISRLTDRNRWYVVMTQPGKEVFAAQNLVNQNFQVFLPRTPTTYRSGRRFATRLSPLFPQYLFLLMNPARQRWRSVNGTMGVRTLIAGADGPQAVRSGLVEALLESCDHHEVVKIPANTLKPGDSVKLIAGPLAGIVGTLLSLSSSGRVKLLLDMMNGQISVNSDADLIAGAP